MDWDQWKSWYLKIISDFGYNPEKDLESSSLLNGFLESKRNIQSFKNLSEIIYNNIIFIYGCGPSLPHHLKNLKDSRLSLENYVHIAADGATSALLEFDIIPNIVVTDLDGQIADLIRANELGATVIIHAHGDNVDAIQQNISIFPGNLIGSTQNEPLGLVENLGGFTDGDRCAFLAESLGASVIILFGFDFGRVVGKYSKPNLEKDEPASAIKLKKLDWAQTLIKELSNRSQAVIIKINAEKPVLGKVKNFSFENLLEFLISKKIS
jgi:uncharacterized Rossmann fold enzyme